MRQDIINSAIDRHFPSNKGAFKVGDYAGKDMKPFMYMDCYCPNRDLRIAPVWVALFVLRNYPDVEYIKYYDRIFTRETLRRSGRKL